MTGRLRTPKLRSEFVCTGKRPLAIARRQNYPVFNKETLVPPLHAGVVAFVGCRAMKDHGP